MMLRSCGASASPPRRARRTWPAAAQGLLGGLAAAVVAGTAAAAAAGATPLKAAVFPAELVDTSTEGDLNGARADETARLRLITGVVAEGLAASGAYTVVDIAPAQAAIDAAGSIRGCNGCDIDIAKSLGADVSVIAVVQKVSNLILDVHLYVRDVRTGKVVRTGDTSIRGNTDESWTRGARWLLRNRILAEPPPAAASTAKP